MKKIIIIGAGISGLTAGIYGRINGFETEIYEMHTIPGGECTGWNRKEYYFDGCIHWLVGSKAGNSLNKIWREIGALDDRVNIINQDYFYSYEEDGQIVYLYKDVPRLKEHLMEIAPLDEKMITYMCKAIEGLKCIQMPTEKPFDLMNLWDTGKMLKNMFPALKYLARIEKMTIEEFADQFNSAILRNALTKLIPPHYSATALLTTIASMADGDSGWPEGGSLALARRVEEKYRSLGGKVSYKARVKRILIEDGKAKGILLEDGTEHYADYVISTADGHATLFDILEGNYLDDQLKTLYSDSEAYPVYTTVQVSLGVNYDLSEYPHSRIVALDGEIDSGGQTHQHIGFRHFSYDNTLMPEGKSALEIVLAADFNWWEEKYQDKEVYQREKEKIASQVKQLAEHYYPEIKDKIEVVDVATPMTYVRYCNAWQGSWMSWANTPKGKIKYISGKLPGLDNFYLSGQWTMPPGGLPTAAVTGRWVIQRITKLEKGK